FSFCSRPSSRSTLFPYTTLFRSRDGLLHHAEKIGEMPARGLSLGLVEQIGFRIVPVDDRQAVQMREIPPLRRQDRIDAPAQFVRSEEHTSELQSLRHIVCRLLLE